MWSRHWFLLLCCMTLLPQATNAQDQNIKSGCGANVGNVSQATVSITVDCQAADGPAVTFSYSRLFGAFEVPLLMDIIPDRAIEPGDLGSGGYREYASANGFAGRQYLHERLLKFRNRYPYRDASPILTPFWRDIAGKYKSAENIAWRASNGAKDDRFCFFLSPQIDQAGEASDFFKRRNSAAVKRCDARADRYNKSRIHLFDN